MEEVRVSSEPAPEQDVVKRIKDISFRMNGWLKFVGIMLIIGGAISALSIVGIIVAWVPIWLGVLLLQAGGKASNAQLTDNPMELVLMMDKLRLFFIILGIMIIVELVLVFGGFVFFHTFLTQMMQNMPEF